MTHAQAIGQSQYEMTPEALAWIEEENDLLDQIHELKVEAEQVGDAWNAHSDFDSCLQAVDAPPEIMENLARIRCWLESRTGTITATMNELNERHLDMLK